MNRLITLALLLGAVPAFARDDVRRFAVGRFDTVELSSADRVSIAPGAAVSVRATGDPRAVSTLTITVRNGTLRVGRTPGSHGDRGATVIVTTPTLRAVSLSGSGSIHASAVAGAGFIGRLGGSGSLIVDGLAARDVRFNLSRSGSLVARGRTDRLAIDLSGSGEVDTRGVATPIVTIALGGSGSVTAAAAQRAVVDAGSSGSVRVTGGARCDVRKGGSAFVRCG